ncbi:CDP-glucose 4,6-dehydratase [Leptospira wolbachii]|uniref:CDP-glucose 4,6-dehydratase n=1 Tax=Leptospira wolbachii TaxID=29511 RepID=UPI0018DE0A7F
MTKSTFKDKKVIVTGHTGFKGSWLSLWLLSLGAKVVGISDVIPTNPSNFEVLDIAKDITDIRLDIRDADALKKVILKEKPDFLFHLAAQPLVRLSYKDPLLTYTSNVIGTANVLEALREYDKPCSVVMITSDKAYDNVEWVWGYRENDALGGSDPYSASKGAAELVIKSYIKSFFKGKDSNIKIGVARAGNVIGGGDWALDRIVPDAVTAWSRGETVQLRNPNATRPWQHVLEPLGGYLNLAMTLVSDDRVQGEAFNFGPPAENNHSVIELVKEMSLYWDKVKYEDISESYVGPHEAGLLKLNCDKALVYLQWKAVLGFKETVQFTAEWYKTYYTNSIEILKTTIAQIQQYQDIAKIRGLEWAQ